MNFLAYAMGTGAGGEGAQGGGLSAFIPLILMFVIFYFLLIRPQQKKAKQHKQMIESLKVGDNIITIGGIYGQVTGLGDGVITVEIAPKVRVKLSKASVSAVLGRGTVDQQQSGKE